MRSAEVGPLCRHRQSGPESIPETRQVSRRSGGNGPRDDGSGRPNTVKGMIHRGGSGSQYFTNGGRD